MGNATAHWSSRTYRNRKTEFPHIGSLQNRPLARFARCRLYSQTYKNNSNFDGDLLFSKIANTIQVLTVISYFPNLQIRFKF